MRRRAYLESITRERWQLKAYAALALGVFVLVALLQFSGQVFFQRFIGALNPLVAVLFVITLGLVALSWLLVEGGFAITRRQNRNGLVRATGLAAVFGGVAILADFKIVYPADINIPLPWALLFYPAIGFFVEILFHALPLAILLAMIAPLKNVSRPPAVLLCLFVVALLEPFYQVQWMTSSGPYPAWAIVFVALHVFLINLAQLLLFRRYDFVTMLAFRLVYYLIWHIGWGTLRLSILF